MATQTPFMAKLTQWMGLRRHRMWLRYRDDISTRSIPKPNIPPGCNSKISNNYYCSRDARRDMAPSVILRGPQAQPKQIGEEQTESKVASFPTPGFTPQWTMAKEET